ncbi:MAG: phosphohydrolase [Burkholderiaceae bacterium]|nr:phosphohydrolase [Burkholderiaceae bacterium]
MTTLLKLIPGQIVLGMPLPFGVRDEHGQLLLARGHLIATEAQLTALLSRGIYADAVEVEASKGGRSDKVEAKRLTMFDLWDQAIWRLERVLKGIDQEPGFAQRCDEFASQMMGLVERDPDIAIYLSVRQDERRLAHYGLTHALHCALVCQLMGTRSGWPVDRIRTLVKAALTMNLAIIELQGRYAVHGRLSDEQMADIRRHPAQAVERLQAAGVDDAEWLQTVLEHHERPGGGGYPSDLKDVSEAGNVLRLADVFMAKISPRASRPAISIQEAARQMYSESGGSTAAAAIIKEYGVYPPGNFVRLASGELAIVIRRGATALTPVAAAITDTTGTPTIHTKQRDTAQPAYAIKGIEASSPLLLRVPPERLYGLVE